MMTLEDFMDYLTHDVPAEDWEEECENMEVRTPDGVASLKLLAFDHCLEDPRLSKWRHAFVWQLIDHYGDEATVIEISKPPITTEHQPCKTKTNKTTSNP